MSGSASAVGRSGGAIVVAAPAKLTLSLRIVGTRSDGFHLIDAEMVTVSLADELRIDPDGDSLEVTPAGSGLPVTVGPDNSIARALGFLGRTAAVHVTKRIPAGAGLGGGSADAAAILRWAGMNDPLAAVELGADVAFCLRGGRARVTGIGEHLEELPHVPAIYTLSIPPFGCSTPQVYRAWDALGGPSASGPNDLELAALAVAPELARWRDALGEATGETPTLAGSGSTWFVPGAHRGEGRMVVETLPPSDGHVGASGSSPGRDRDGG